MRSRCDPVAWRPPHEREKNADSAGGSQTNTNVWANEYVRSDSVIFHPDNPFWSFFSRSPHRCLHSSVNHARSVEAKLTPPFHSTYYLIRTESFLHLSIRCPSRSVDLAFNKTELAHGFAHLPVKHKWTPSRCKRQCITLATFPQWLQYAVDCRLRSSICTRFILQRPDYGLCWFNSWLFRSGRRTSFGWRQRGQMSGRLRSRQRSSGSNSAANGWSRIERVLPAENEKHLLLFDSGRPTESDPPRVRANYNDGWIKLGHTRTSWTFGALAKKSCFQRFVRRSNMLCLVCIPFLILCLRRRS